MFPLRRTKVLRKFKELSVKRTRVFKRDNSGDWRSRDLYICGHDFDEFFTIPKRVDKIIIVVSDTQMYQDDMVLESNEAVLNWTCWFWSKFQGRTVFLGVDICLYLAKVFGSVDRLYVQVYHY